MTIQRGLVVLALLTGCVAAPARTGGAPVETFTGEVWVWDEQTNVVTLRQGLQTIRVRVTPDQLIGLRLHQMVTLQGEPAGPAEIERVVTAPPALVPSGAADETETRGTVARIDPAGTLTVDTPRGPVTVWRATPGPTSFRVGQAVRVGIRVQPLAALPPGVAPPRGPDERAAPSTAAMAEPGDYAAVRGRIGAVSPTGQLTVESSRGAVQVWVPNAARYGAGQWAEVRTSVHPAR